MALLTPPRLASLALLAGVGLFATQAQAVTYVVSLNALDVDVTLNTPINGGDTLRLDTLVTAATGALSQTITFTLGASVAGVGGQAAWEIGTAAGPGPRLVGVNLDLFDAGNTLIVSDGNVNVANGYATSSFASTMLGPGTYKLVATGNGVRESSLDVTLNFAPVPEPGSVALMLAGVGVLGLLTRRRGRADAH